MTLEEKLNSKIKKIFTKKKIWKIDKAILAKEGSRHHYVVYFWNIKKKCNYSRAVTFPKETISPEYVVQTMGDLINQVIASRRMNVEKYLRKDLN